MAATDAPPKDAKNKTKGDENAPKDGEGSPEAEAPKEPRKLSIFTAFGRVKGEVTWTQLPGRYEGITQDQAKRAAAQQLEKLEDGHEYQAFRDAILEGGTGLELAAVSERVWQPITVQVVPQPAKLVIGAKS